MSQIDPKDVTWVRVEQPVFDLWGVITSSLTFAVGLLVLGLVLGGLVGWLRIRRLRSRADAGSLLSDLARPLPPAPSVH